MCSEKTGKRISNVKVGWLIAKRYVNGTLETINFDDQRLRLLVFAFLRVEKENSKHKQRLFSFDAVN